MSATVNETISETGSMSVKETINAMAPDKKRALKGWYFYDWANQAYALTVMTVIAPALMGSLFNQATGGESDFFGFKVTGDSFYAIVLMVAMGVVALTAPALGVIADRMPVKKKLLKWYTAVGIIFTAMMGAAP
jgi:UMF1 family MFS transporter